MYIFRWLMQRPVIILPVYFFVLFLILLSMTDSDDTGAKVVEVAKDVELVDTDKSSTAEPEVSKLTGADVAKDLDKTEEAKEAKVETVEVEKDTPSTTMEEDLKVTDAQGTQFNEMSAEELLLMAREAYWNNGLEESEEIYRKLIELNPEVIDYKGELGNVYWRKGEPKKAAALYAEIALPMIEAGDKARVANMVGFIGFHYPETAAEIHNALEAKK